MSENHSNLPWNTAKLFHERMQMEWKGFGRHHTVIGAAERGTNLVRNVVWHGSEEQIKEISSVSIAV